jgi:hypothetical protein
LDISSTDCRPATGKNQQLQVPSRPKSRETCAEVNLLRPYKWPAPPLSLSSELIPEPIPQLVILPPKALSLDNMRVGKVSDE